MIAVEHLSVTFDGKQVLSDFCAVFPANSITLICGASGCGKTTLLRTIAGLQRPSAGTVTLAPYARISMAFQEPRLFSSLTVLEQLTTVGAEKEQALALLAEAGLAAEADSYPDTLSGGMQSRVGVLRALAAECEILLLDEPLSGLDAETAARMVSLIGAHGKDKTILVVTHHPDAFAPLQPRVLQLS